MLTLTNVFKRYGATVALGSPRDPAARGRVSLCVGVAGFLLGARLFAAEG